MCLDTLGCKETFDCMRATECKGSTCLQRCRGSDYPPEAFAYAEALWACHRGSACGCGASSLPSVACPSLQGELQCEPYVGVVEISACCTSAAEMGTEPVGAEQELLDSTNPCGLELGSFVRSARPCEPRTQAHPPRYEVLETCPDGAITGPPYSGALLRGCCREDRTCGYYDDVTGLGCLSTTTFGQAALACP